MAETPKNRAERIAALRNDPRPEVKEYLAMLDEDIAAGDDALDEVSAPSAEQEEVLGGAVVSNTREEAEEVSRRFNETLLSYDKAEDED